MSQKFGSFQGTGNTKYLNYNGSVTSGDIWFDHSNAAIKIYNGTSWDEVGSGSGGGGITYSVHTSNVTATANQGIIADTSGGSFTATLPASPTTGDKVFIADGADFSTNNLTVARNGSTIEGASEDFVMDIGGPNVGFIYDGTTWQVYPQSGLMGLRGIDDNATSTAITIDSSQNVGIGTTNPTAYANQTNLNINSSGVSRIDFDISDSLQGYALAESGYVGLFANTGNYLALGANNAEHMRIDSSGNVGIGTASPAGNSLTIEKSSVARLRLSESGVRAWDIEATAGSWRVNNATNAIEAMRIDLNGNVMIKNTTGASFTLNAATDLSIGSGSASAGMTIYTGGSNQGAISFADGTTGDQQYRGYIVYTHSTDVMQIGTSGTEAMRIDSSGNVGIGTNSPWSDAKLTIDNGGSGSVSMALTRSGSGQNDVALVNDAGEFIVKSGAASTVAGLTNQMRISDAGNVYFGTDNNWFTSSGRKILRVHGAGGGSFLVLDTSGSGDFYIGVEDSGLVNFWNQASAATVFGTNNTERMRIDASGYVGIGTGSPGSYYAKELVVNCANEGGITINGDTSDGQYLMFADGTSGNARYRGYIAYDHSNDLMGIASHDDIRFLSGSTTQEAVRIDSSGNLLVGTTSATVSGAAGFGVLPAGNAGASPFVFSSSDASVNSHITWAAYSRGVSAYRFYVGYGGTIHATSTSITAISDASLKENVRDLDKGLATINALQPRRFDWKNGDGNDIMGFVAQEVEDVLPELVHEYRYSEEATKLGLKMGDMIPSMVKAIQELSAQVDQLKAEVAALKGE